MCKLLTPVPNPTVVITIELDSDSKQFASDLYAEILKDDWDQGELPNTFFAKFEGTTDKTEHIEELLGYAEEIVIDSAHRIHSKHCEIEGVANVFISGIGKYEFSFCSTSDSRSITEEIEAFYTIIEEDGI